MFCEHTLYYTMSIDVFVIIKSHRLSYTVYSIVLYYSSPHFVDEVATKSVAK